VGGFVLTNDRTQDTREKILGVFEKKGMTRFTDIDLANYRLFYFNKVNLPDVNHIFNVGQDYIIGVGTFAYGGSFGQKALRKLYERITSERKFDEILNGIKGHFTIIIFFEGELTVVADRVGSYHTFIGHAENNVYVSNSFYAVADNMPKLSVRKQEMMEFLITESVYGPNTLFDEIKYLGFGQYHKFGESGEVESTRYHQEHAVGNDYSLESHYNAIVEYLSFLKDVELSLSPDLTAGYDTRLMCAILKHLGIKYTMNTNYNSWDTTDLEYAEAIAKAEGVQLAIYRKDLSKMPYDELLSKSIHRTELYRDMFQAAYSFVFFDEKTRDFNMIFGGYGGELYRDSKYHGFDSIESLITSKYVDKRMAKLFDPHEVQEYRAELERKMKAITGRSDNSLSKVDCEKIYYFLRMMYWGGSRITYFNYYGYRYHPLLDYDLIYPLFHIGDDSKHDGKFQMRTIERFDHRLASYPSNYGHNFIWDEARHNIKKPPRFITRVFRFILRKLQSSLSRSKVDTDSTTSWQDEEDRIVWKGFVEDDLLIHRFFDGLQVRGDEMYLGRIYSIEVLLERYKSKINDLE
jgi:hypothetical protein